ncbi:cell division control protein C [Trifolium repens]|nr:cell division control protein C [Trifolium repens]
MLFKKKNKKKIIKLLLKKEETTSHNKSSMSCDSVLVSDSEFNNGGENVMNDVNMRKVGTRFKDLGGMEEVIEDLKKTILKPLFNPKVCKVLGLKPINGLLLHGLPGCGKTKLAHAIAY